MRYLDPMCGMLQPQCGLSQPLHGMLQHLGRMHSLYVGFFILCVFCFVLNVGYIILHVGYCSPHAGCHTPLSCYAGTMWAVKDGENLRSQVLPHCSLLKLKQKSEKRSFTCVRDTFARFPKSGRKFLVPFGKYFDSLYRSEGARNISSDKNSFAIFSLVVVAGSKGCSMAI